MRSLGPADLSLDDPVLKRYSAVLRGEEMACFLKNGQRLAMALEKAKAMFRRCELCERRCKADRTKKAGACGVSEARVASHFIHMGEEPEIIPSFTVFFAGCNLKCVYCQNWDISQDPECGEAVAPSKMAKMIDGVEARNVNWVGGDPIPNIPYILEVLTHTRKNIPQVFNSNMYMTEEALGILDGLVDVYLSDLKYGNNECGKRLSKVERYFDVVARNHEIANRQAEMVVRHLMLPGHYECCTVPVIEWLAGHLDRRNFKLNVMAQYHPEHLAKRYPGLEKRIDLGLYYKARDLASELGIALTD